jgi:hypothetical protein
VTVVCCARRRSITRAASGCTPRSGTQVSSGSVIKSSSTVQEWPNRPVGFPVGLQGVGGADLLAADPAMDNSLPRDAPFSEPLIEVDSTPAASRRSLGLLNVVGCTSTVVPAARVFGLAPGACQSGAKIGEYVEHAPLMLT